MKPKPTSPTSEAEQPAPGDEYTYTMPGRLDRLSPWMQQQVIEGMRDFERERQKIIKQQQGGQSRCQ